MKLITLCLAASIALAVAGCASAPSAPTTVAAAAPECRQLDAEIARTVDARRAAADREQNAWKAVVPFAVAARHVSGKIAESEAEQQLAALRAERDRQGCQRHGD